MNCGVEQQRELGRSREGKTEVAYMYTYIHTYIQK